MWINELTEAECEAVLERATIARLATCLDDRPYVVPISIKFERDGAVRFLYSFANLGQKVRWMRRNPFVAAEIEEVVDPIHWTTVLVSGVFEELDPVQRREDTDRAYALLRSRSDWWLPGAARTPASDLYTPVVYRIRIESISGRRAERRPPV
jgi:nitroimidazol reductase NimA-like FMN-containing flavoprotein (pyridoxamine 5'-phosphate oxidase superfamily)